MVTINDILSRLENVKASGAGWETACPLCQSKHHLYIRQTDDDKILIYCQKCQGGYKEVLEAIGISTSDFHEADRESVVVEEYDHIYRNPDGTEAYRKTRKKWANGKKKFTFWYKDEHGTHYSKPDGCNNLYNLDLLEQTDPATTLYIVEGEKCADACTENGLLATTSNTGGGNRQIKFSKEDLRLLDKFQRQVVIPDNDETGQEYAQNFPNANVLQLSDIWREIPKKGDIADFFAEGFSADLITGYSFYTVDFASATADQILCEHDRDLYYALLNIKNPLERKIAEGQVTNAARKYSLTNQFQSIYKQIQQDRAASISGQGSQNKTQFTGQPMVLNCGEWTADDTGVYHMVSSGNGSMTRKYASYTPILPTEILFNEEQNLEKIRIAWFKDRWRSLVCERVTTATANRITDLSNQGVEVTSENSKELVKYIADLVAFNRIAIPRKKSISRLGWVGSEFMPYSQDISFDGEKETKYLYDAIKSYGTLEEWKQVVAPLRENHVLRLVMAASFASPIIEPVNALPFVLHLWGGTGTAKTVSLMVAMSVWGDPRMGKLVRTMNMTQNSMMATSAFLYNLPFAGDELQTIKNQWDSYDTMIMRITEGIDRGRMKYDRLEPTKAWKCAYLFSGEEPCTHSSSGGGVKNRVIEIECREPLVQDGNAVVNAITKQYGTAGPEYIKGVMELKKSGALPKMYKSLFDSFIEDKLTTEKQAMAAALLMLGDSIVHALFFPGEREMVKEDIMPFLRSADEVDTAKRSYDYVLNLISQNASKFIGSDAYGDHHGEIWGRIDKDSDCILFNKEVLATVLHDKGFEFDAIKAKWAERGYLKLTTQKRFIEKNTVGGMNTYCARISKSAVSELNPLNKKEDIPW